jgi:hypothetical protein
MSTASKALAALLRDSEKWREFFGQCCAHGSRRLRAQARRQFREELAHQGDAFSPSEVEDAALIAARKLLRNTLAAEWDAEHADRICKEAMTRMSECFAKLSADEKDRINLDGQDGWHDRMYRAGIDNDSAAFREALEGWERAGLEALADLRREGAA